MLPLPDFTELDSINKEIILLITKGFTSSYSVWSAMRKNAENESNPKKVLAYVNINQRTLNLAKSGFIEEIKIDLVNMHNRRDYKATIKGMEQLIPYVLSHPEEAQNLAQYMDKYGLDKEAFRNLLLNRITSIVDYTNLFLGPIERKSGPATLAEAEAVSIHPERIPEEMAQIEHLKGSITDLHVKLMDIGFNLSIIEKTQIAKVKSRTGRTQIFKGVRIPDHPYGEYDEQEHRRMVLNEPEIADRELEENIYRQTKSSSSSKKPLPSQIPKTQRKKQ